jgi:ribosomal protein L11 methyltransferase
VTVEARRTIAPARAEAWAEALAAHGDPRWSVFEDVARRRACLSGFFASAAEARAAWTRLAAGLPAGLASAGQPRLAPAAEADWRESYKAHFKPWRCGRLHWVPEWERAGYRLPHGHVAVWLDPGLAFGTGNHETTRLCVEALVAWARRRPLTARAALRVTDAGCGSGILAISAAKLGCGRVAAFDIDPEAVRVARGNTRRNGVADYVRLRTGDLDTGLPPCGADLLLANIQADVLQRFAPQLMAAVAPAGTLVTSGILVEEIDRVAAAFAQPGWRLRRRTRGMWAALIATRLRPRTSRADRERSAG